MAFTSGTATDYIDLANKFRTWMTGTAGWTQLAWTPGTLAGGGMVLSLRGPGAASDKQVFVNIRSQHDDVNLFYSWDIRAAIGRDSSLPFGGQPGESTPTYLFLWKSAITYWIYANDRRFVLIAKVNTNYMSAYAGFYLPWATPAQYPFPLYVGASSGFQQTYNSTRSSNRMFCDPGGAENDSSTTDYNAAKVRLPDGSWSRVCNHANVTGNDAPYGSQTTKPFIWPFVTRGSYTGLGIRAWSYGGQTSSGISADDGMVDNLVATAQGERMMLPTYIMQGSKPSGFGALDGVYFPMGQGLTPEQTAVLSTRTFRMFNNVARSSGNDFFAIEEN